MAKTDQLQASVYFSSPVYSIEIPEWVDDVNKVCDKYVKDAKKNNAKNIKEREKKFGKKIGDHGMSHHSTSLVGDSGLKELQEYIGATSWNVLDHMGYDLKNYELFWTEFWVQEFGEKGGGHHEGHTQIYSSNKLLPPTQIYLENNLPYHTQFTQRINSSTLS